MTKKILVTGGTGLIGKHVVGILAKNGHEVRVYSRSPVKRETAVKMYHWNPAKGEIDKLALKDLDCIVHLAGEGIADKPWSGRRKKKIIKSRTQGLNLIRKAFEDLGVSPGGMVSASAIGYYTHNKQSVNTENGPKGRGFLAKSVYEWEKAIKAFEPLCPTARMRIGFVLSGEGGGLPQMAQPFRKGLGAPLGSGRQAVSWVHIDDVARGIVYAVENEKSGVYNMVAPNPASNKELSKAVSKAVDKWLLPIKVPAFLLRMAMGERADLVLADNKVIPARLQEEGFEFRYSDVHEAVKVCLAYV